MDQPKTPVTLEMLARLTSDGKAEIFRKHRISVYNVCRRAIRDQNDAEDVCHKVFVKLLSYLESGTANGQTPSLALIFQITRQCIADYGRRRLREASRYAPESATAAIESSQEDTLPGYLVNQRDSDRMLAQIEAELTPAQKQVLKSHLTNTDGAKTSELSDTLGIAPSTYRQHLKDLRGKAAIVFSAVNRRIKG